MPTVLRIGPYRFFFYSNEDGEPPHIHIRSSDAEAKFWLDPVAVAYNYGYRGHELKKIEELVKDNLQLLSEAWYEHDNRKK